MYKIFQDAIIDDELTKRAEAAQTAKKKLNKKGWWTAQAPYGYCKTEASKVYKQAPERAQVVRRMFQTILRGEGIHAFVRKINAEGKTTAKGNLWRLGRFQTAVRNPLYAGLMNVGTKEHPVLISCRSFPEPIITENEWRTAQKIIRGRSQLPTASQTSYPCSGLVFCGDCGRRMQVYGPNKKPEWRKYWCDGSYTVSTDETCKATVNMEDLHAILRHFGLLKSYYDEQVQAEALKSRERLPQLYQRRDELTARLGKLNSKVGDEETDFVFWREAMTNLKIEIDEQTAEIQELEAIPNKMVRSTYDNFVDALALNRPENRGLFRDVIRSLIERIEVTTEAVTIKLNDGYSFPLRRGKKTHKYHRELPKIHVMPTLKGTKLHLSIVQDEPILEPYVQAPNLLVDEIHPEQAQDWPE